MAVVVYKCDTCNREKMIPRNERGMEHVGRCNITLGCRGYLYKIGVNESFQRGDITLPVTGLDDWYQRKVLHNHEQTIATKEWVIKHDIHASMAVSAFRETLEGTLEEIIPADIVHLNSSTMVLRFAEEEDGIAQLVARQSDPNLFKRVPVTEPEDEQAVIRITNDSIITIATRRKTIDEDAKINLKLEFTSARDVHVETYVGVDSEASFESPWNDYDKISLKGEIYTVRDFNFLNEEMGAGGKVTSGSAVAFTEVGLPVEEDIVYRDIKEEEIIILLAHEPYKSIDKNPDQYIDTMSSIIKISSIVYDNGVMYALPSIIEDVYPPIRSV